MIRGECSIDGPLFLYLEQAPDFYVEMKWEFTSWGESEIDKIALSIFDTNKWLLNLYHSHCLKIILTVENLCPLKEIVAHFGCF